MENVWRFPGKWRREWMSVGFVDPNNTGVNYCPLRYADVVLMAAEAYNETNNTLEAWNLLNDVRGRAKATPITSANYSSLLKAPKVYDLPLYRMVMMLANSVQLFLGTCIRTLL